MARLVCLLRGINVGGGNKVPMDVLRAECVALGFAEVRTYIASGNVLIEAAEEPRAVEASLERAVEQRFGLSIPVIARSAAQWSVYSAGSPFPEAGRDEPNRLMLCLSKNTLLSGAADALTARADAGERVVEDRGALWVHYPAGAGRSRLSPALFDRLAGSPVTTRNWRTVRKLQDMLGV